MVDPDMWEKIVLNLLSNAFKFTLAGEIEVRLRRTGDEVVLTVSDTGVGIPERELTRIFERFHRVRAVTARTHEGSGIGLALVRDLVAYGVVTSGTTQQPVKLASMSAQEGGAPVLPSRLLIS